MFGLGSKVRFVAFPKLDPKLSSRFEVVGESHYYENLDAMAKHATPDDQHQWVALRAERSNPVDPDAIRVDWVKPDGSGWLTCGYIPRANTAQWHPIVASAPKGTVWVWPAHIIGGRSGQNYGLVFFS